MDWITELALRVILTVVVVIILTRIHGLRSFSKMSGFDFAITVSIGSVLAGAVTTFGTDLHIFVGALIGLFAVQLIIAQVRARVRSVKSLVDNEPMLVMERGEPLEDNLKKAGMSLDDLWSKLREANAYDLKTVHAVIVEATGDVSVLHGDPDGAKPDERLLEGVRR